MLLNTLHQLYWALRDVLVRTRVLPRPRFYMRRLPMGGARARLMGRGSSRRLRRLSLQRLLATAAHPMP